jgi:predicted RNA-binding Zn-ribbon protein involved in translation (DUF1610 family)
MKQKKPRFFCDGCGTEVAANVERCPRCGKFFASIRCPKCGFNGDADMFSNGCPVCGYSAQLSNRAGNRQNRPPPPADGAAPWLYIVSIALLAMLLTALLIYTTN